MRISITTLKHHDLTDLTDRQIIHNICTKQTVNRAVQRNGGYAEIASKTGLSRKVIKHSSWRKYMLILGILALKNR